MKFVTFSEKDKKTFDEFIERNSFDGGLLQRWSWGEFKKNQSSGVFRFGVLNEEGQILLAATILKQKFAKVFQIFYSPRGPVFSLAFLEDWEKQKEIFAFFFSEIHKLAKKEKVVMLRLDPAWDMARTDRNILNSLGFTEYTKRSIQPTHTLLVPLAGTQEEILANFKPKTRYNVRLSERKGVVIKEDVSGESFDTWMELLNKTAKRHNFKQHSRDYFKRLFDTMIPEKRLHLFIAYYENQAIAANLVLTSGKTAYYLYGASENIYKNVMAPYLLHWEVMKSLKKQGYIFYDLWGISGKSSYVGLKDEREKNWEGFSRLKRGFAANSPITEYIGTWEYPYKNFIYKFLGFFR